MSQKNAQEINLFGLCQTKEEKKQSLKHIAFSKDSLKESNISWIKYSY